MSLSLNIAPATDVPTWGDVRRRLDRDGLSIKPWGRDTPMADDERFTIGEFSSVQAANIPGLHLSVGLFANDEVDADPAAWLAAFRTVGPDRDAVAEAWARVGYFFGLESGVGRQPGELQVMAALAAALAESVSGRVVLSDSHIFDVGAGVYSGAEFRGVHPLH